MNTQIKFISAIVGLLLMMTGQLVKAQKTSAGETRLGIAFETALPTGTGAKDYTISLGGTGTIQYGLNDHVALTFTSGYYNFLSKTLGTPFAPYKRPNLQIVPMKVGAKVFFYDGFYASAETGMAIEAVSGGRRKFILAPALGYATKQLDVSLRYEALLGGLENYGLVGLHTAYGFKL
ncbi:MAG: hypothetical protein JWQ57_4316 [Mucilaginibacter sp.]|nr:hypothetical protein [Mucilaginibacter sp.]